MASPAVLAAAMASAVLGWALGRRGRQRSAEDRKERGGNENGELSTSAAGGSYADDHFHLMPQLAEDKHEACCHLNAPGAACCYIHSGPAYSIHIVLANSSVMICKMLLL